MFTLGLLFRGPLAIIEYAKINPWYINTVIPRLFVNFTKNYTRMKKTLSSVIVDTLIISWPM